MINSDARLFYGTTGPRNARIAFVGECWGSEEAKQTKPLVGESGKLFDSMLADAGLSRSDVFCTNVFNAQPQGGESHRFFLSSAEAKAQRREAYRGMYPTPFVMQSLERLYAQLAAVKPEVIVVLGNYALWALTDHAKISNGTKFAAGYKVPSGIARWRGSQTYTRDGVRCVPVLNPAAILRDWASRYPAVHDLRTRVAPKGLVWEPSWQFILRPSFEQVMTFLDAELTRCTQSGAPIWYGTDIETRRRDVACISLTQSETNSICIPFLCVERADGYWTLDEEIAIWKQMRKLFKHPNFFLVGQNFNYDAQFLGIYLNFRVLPHFDTMLAQHILFPGTPKGLDYIASIYCRYYLYWKEDGKEWDPSVPEDQLWRYNCIDGVRTLEVAHAQNEAIDKMNLRAQFNEWMQCAELGLHVTQRGLRVDQYARQNMATGLLDLLTEMGIWFNKLIPVAPKKKPWWGSPQQLMTILYEEMGFEPIRDRKTRQPTVGEEALQTLAKREPLLKPLVEMLIHYRNTVTISANFVQRPFDADGRFRPGVNVGGTETFRWSTSENALGTGGNMQNVPRETGRRTRSFLQPNVRLLFTPDIGYDLLDVDLSGADAQVVAWEAGDEDLKAAFQAGLKVHAKNALDMFGKRAGPDGRQEPLYTQNKQAVHGTNYGASARALAVNNGWTVHEAEMWQRRWFELHPAIREWQRRVEAELRASRTVSNSFGYRRTYFDRVEGLLPQALAWKPQSTIALVTFKAAMRVRKMTPWCEVLLQVHDSLLLQYPRHLRNRLNEVREALTVTIPYADPLTIQWGLKSSTESWGKVEDAKWPASPT